MKTLKTVRLAFLLSLFFSVVSMQAQASCLLPGTTHSENITALSNLLPGDARGALAVDTNDLLSGSYSSAVEDLVNGVSGDPALLEPLSAINRLADSVNAGLIDTALLAQTTDASDALFLIAKVNCDTVGEATTGTTANGTHNSHAMRLDANGNSLSILTGGVLIVGKLAAVQVVLDIADSSPAASGITPYLSVLDSGSPLSFVYALPGTDYNPGDYTPAAPDLSFMGAEMVSGSVGFSGTNISGSASFYSSNIDHTADHTDSNSGSPVYEYHTLNAWAVDEAPLVVNAASGSISLDSIEVTIPSTPINKSAAELMTSRNLLRKLVIGMQQWDHSFYVYDDPDDLQRSNQPWLDLTVVSEADGTNQPGSVFIRWEFKDDNDQSWTDPKNLGRTAREAYEADELPAGFTLKAMKFLEEDANEPHATTINNNGTVTGGEGYFLTLNLYNSQGAFVADARAEWDIFVTPANGDPRPRFMVIDALAAAVSADPVDGLTGAEALTHEFSGNQVVTSVSNHEGLVFASSFDKPVVGVAPVARFTRAMAAGNDAIYWRHGIHDHGLYNASTFNYDAYFVNNASIQITDNHHFTQYLKSTPTYAVYYENTLEYCVALWANMDSQFLDMGNPVPPLNTNVPEGDPIVPYTGTEWLEQLYLFRNNGNFKTLMKDTVRSSFKGTGDAMKPYRIANTTPAAYYHYTIGDPGAMETALNLPTGHSLAQTSLVEGDGEAYYLTLSVFEIEDAVEGIRAEWSVYTDDGNGGPEHFMVIDLATEDAAVDPISMINLPTEVSHGASGGGLSTVLSSSTVDFTASFDFSGSEVLPSLDWVEAIDFVCYLNGICTKLYYGEGTLDDNVHVAANVSAAKTTPWDQWISAAPSAVYYRDNAQHFAVKPWLNAKVEEAEPPTPSPPPIPNATHTISGTGSLVAHNPLKNAINSDYTYTGSVAVSGNTLYFSKDQFIDNPIGQSHMFMTGSFDLTTGVGTSTIIDCIGNVLICAGADPVLGTPEATSDYQALNIDISNPDNISWEIEFLVVVSGFGEATSASTFNATLGYTPPVDPPSGGCAYNPRGGIDMLLMILLACGIFYGRNIRINRIGSSL